MADMPRILNLEDNPIDAELIREKLWEHWPDCSIARVDTEPDFIQGLQGGGIDLVLADYSLPNFDGMSALAIVREYFPDIPFIFVSGTLGEETAIDTLKNGATDYVLKQRLSRLVPAVKRALSEVEERTARKQADEQRAQLEGQLRHAQKMEAIGTLAGGIAHDFNNILNVIMGYGAFVMDGLGMDSPLRTQMNEVLAAAEKAAHLTGRLLLFSRKEAPDVKAVNVNELIVGIQKMLQRIIGEDIELSMKIADKCLPVMADSAQIEQVLMNLVTNARDAMPSGGKLTIAAGIEEIGNAFISAYGYGQPGMYARITVSDTGCGMDSEVRKKIFEPFFTTKEIGRGTGLGLAISYGIVKQHGGYIDVSSQVGKGADFRLYLPLIEASALDADKVEVSAPILGGNETVLVVEDDTRVRELIKIVLGSYGYRVIHAVDGEDAVARFSDNREAIQLVILDVIMPKKSGPEAYEEIKKIAPGIKILFASGYPGDMISRLGIDKNSNFIQKPFTPKVLLNKVRTILDK